MSYSCQNCQKEFSNKKFFDKHVNNSVCVKTFICSKCNAEFATAHSLRRHLNRKTPCIPDSIPIIKNGNTENRCQYCNNTFASAYNLRRHQNGSCDKDMNMRALLRQLEEKDEKIALLQENAQLRAQLAQQNQTVINNNVTVNQVQQNLHVNNNMYVNVTICSFGKEDLSQLDTSKVMNLLKGQIKDFMPRMIEHVHANPDHPEYHNVFYDPERQKAIVFAPNESGDQMTWYAKDFTEISKQITDKIKEHIHPTAGPYFNIAMQSKDTETANKIIQLSNEEKYDSPEALEQNKSSLTKVTKNKGFTELVEVVE